MDESEKMVTSDDENSSSSDDEEKELEHHAADLERQVSDNMYFYDVHVELVDLYEKLGDLKSLRAAYERFSQYFPLTPKIWLTWIRNEIKIASSSAEKKYILCLFDKAVEDYQSIDIWLEYVQFCIGSCESEETYTILERGLNTVGLNANHGSLLWDTLRELELAHLSSHEQLSEEWRVQANKVANAFRRQLSVPLLGMESTYIEWKQWLKQLPAGHDIDHEAVEWTYTQALKLLNKYKPFEEQLLTADHDEEVLAVYKDYINIVTDPATILCLYERAVAQLSLHVVLWNEYCAYGLKLGDIAYSISKRALRNCPWSEDLWIMRMRILEQQKCSDKEVMECLEQGLTAIIPSPGLNLWLSYLEYVRRSENSTEHLHKVFVQASEQLGELGDPTCKILRLQARLYARQANMAKARRVWSHILHYPSHKSTASAWLEYASLEKQYGDAQQLRVLYQRAISSCIDWPQCIVEDWLMYERECGSLQDMLKCVEKCSQVAQPNEQAPNQVAAAISESRKRPYEANGRTAKGKRLKTVEQSEQLHPKRKTAVADIDSEKSVFLSNMREDINEDKLQELFPNAAAICVPRDKKGNSRCYAYVQFADKEQVETALSRDREPIDGRPLFISKCLLDQTQRKGSFKYSTRGEENKLFVRGLPVNFTQEDVEGIFKPYEATAVRLVIRRSGRSKGLAYIEFSSKEKAQEALKATDQMNVEGHVISVAVSAPPPKKNVLNADVPASFAPTRHARSRLQVPLVPRSVQTKNPETPSQGPSKTNEDFRKLFNKT